jgi:hypothetical protein
LDVAIQESTNNSRSVATRVRNGRFTGEISVSDRRRVIGRAAVNPSIEDGDRKVGD